MAANAALNAGRILQIARLDLAPRGREDHLPPTSRVEHHSAGAINLSTSGDTARYGAIQHGDIHRRGKFREKFARRKRHDKQTPRCRVAVRKTRKDVNLVSYTHNFSRVLPQVTLTSARTAEALEPRLIKRRRQCRGINHAARGLVPPLFREVVAGCDTYFLRFRVIETPTSTWCQSRLSESSTRSMSS